MAIELNVNSVKTTLSTATDLSPETGTAESKKLGSVLGGVNVRVTSGAMSDLEKLVARLKNETDEAKMSVTQTRISVLNTVLDSMMDRVSQKERDTLVEIEKLNGEKSGIERELYGLENQKTLLDVKIAELERAIERAVQDGKDHRETVAKLKEQLAAERQKLDQVNTAIASANSKISGLDAKIAECSQSIAQTTLNEVSSALRIAASSWSSSSTGEVSDMSNADRVKDAKKELATDIGNVIREALDKITEEINQRLDEARELVKA